MNVTLGPKFGEDRRVCILGIRSFPGGRGGIETFAEHLSLHLVEQGWSVSVYCRTVDAPAGEAIDEDIWRGVTRILVPVRRFGAAGAIEFALKCIRDVRHRRGTVLVLGYTAGIFTPLLRFSHDRVVITMDGLEWTRHTGSWPVRVWLWLNEWVAAWAGTRLVADNPEIARHLCTRTRRSKITMIPYGAPEILDSPVDPLAEFGVRPDGYFISIGRIVPENSILLLVRAFSRCRRGVDLVVLGRFDPQNAFHCAVIAAASDEVRFVGAIHDPAKLRCLRFHARAYCHGQTVGGTDPSLVEALGAGNATLAHDNRVNRWTAGDGQFYFRDEDSCSEMIAEITRNLPAVERARQASRQRFRKQFVLDSVHIAYERLLRSGGGRTRPKAFTPR
jgi:glycosyltransferase involved in cell wall biosynthesis